MEYIFYSMILCFVYLVNCQSSFPCPNPTEIAPCNCTYDNKTQLMELDCSDAQSTLELQLVFSAYFPFLHFGDFRMVNWYDTPSTVESLPDGIFGNVTFTRIYIMCAQIASLGENVFEKSYGTMKSIRIMKGLLTSFPFDKLSYFTALTAIILDYNNLKNMADLSSETLNYLSIMYNPNLYFSASAFVNTPNLLWLELTGSGQKVIPVNAFATLNSLEYINLAQNQLTILESNSITLPNDTLKYFDVRYNDIKVVQPGALQGIHKACTFYFMSNGITTLEEIVWRPIFEKVAETNSTIGQIFLDYNPLDCTCTIAWLVTNQTLRAEISQFSACANGGPNILELDPYFYLDNC